jgi:hypothetical protein
LNSITGGIDSPVSVKFGLHRTGAAERSASAEGKKINHLPVSSDDLVIYYNLFFAYLGRRPK